MALLKIEQLVERHPGLSVGGVRSDLFHRDANGLAASGALVHRGRHILIDEAIYLDWLKSAATSWPRPRASRSAA